MTFSEWIALKDPKTLSVVLGQEIGTIRVWKTRNVVPRNVWPEIVTRMGLSTHDLLAMEEKSRIRGGKK